MINFVKSFVRDECGASAAEYALILAIVGSGIAVAAFTLGTNISTAMTDAGGCIANPGTAASPNAQCQ